VSLTTECPGVRSVRDDGVFRDRGSRYREKVGDKGERC
jgi:hypothetical protein